MSLSARWLAVLAFGLSACGGGGGGDEGGGTPTPNPGPADPPPVSATAQAQYNERIATPITQGRCVQCHVDSGSAGHTRLILQAGSNHRGANLSVFAGFVDQVSGGAELLLDKASGHAGHVGGTQLAVGSTDYQAFSDFIDLLVSEAGGGDPEPEPEPEPEPPAPTPQTAAEQQYADDVEAAVVQSRCLACHTGGASAGHTPLLFSAGDQQWADNYAAFDAYLQGQGSRAEFVLSKVRGGEGHGGGSVLAAGSSGYQALESFLNAITRSAPPSSSSMFSKVRMASSDTTLRRAAWLLAARLPTEQEQQLASAGQLRDALRGLMQGPAFHDFLIRGANDQLLTDAFLNNGFFDVADPNNPYYARYANRQYETRGSAGDSAWFEWQRLFQFGLARAPLELIAHVVENDRPYTEILTADYTLLNPQTGAMLDPTLSFPDQDPRRFQVGHNRGQIRVDESFQGEFVEGQGHRVDGHSGFLDLPHAGLLNEPAFLSRYPSTETNRNRARARWTLFHFLGLDIEKSAARTTDPVALADNNNPTLNNPHCTVCHQTLDPIAGAFQNFGDEGWFRDSWRGLDALPETYKHSPGSPYQDGDTWYRDMRDPGFDGQVVTDRDRSLAWLAQQIVDDPRFAVATVQFWWPAIMADVPLPRPENSSDAGFDARLSAYQAQQADIQALADQFTNGIAGGAPFNLRDLLVEMILSPWFRAEAAEAALSDTQQWGLSQAGSDRLLTPEELEAKTAALTGFTWRAHPDQYAADGIYSALGDRFRIYYGGIDSLGITERARSLNTLMSNVALAQALSVACPTAVLEFAEPPEQRRLFSGVDRNTTPLTHVRSQQTVTGTDHAQRSQHSVSVNLDASQAQRLRLQFANPYYDPEVRESSLLVIHRLELRDASGGAVLAVNGQDLAQQPGFNHSTNDDGHRSGDVYWDPDQQQQTGWVLWNGWLELPISLPASGNYQLWVEAGRRNLPQRPVELALQVLLDDPHGGSSGEQALRQQLVQLHQRMLGESLSVRDPEIDASYQLLVSLWQERRNSDAPPFAIDWNRENCEIPIPDWWAVDRTAELQDPDYMIGSWTSMLIYFLTDYRYLHE